MKLRSTSKYLRPLTSATVKARVRRNFLARGGTLNRMNTRNREILSDAIFQEEDRIESKAGGRPDHPLVEQLRSCRLLLYDHLGWDDAEYEHLEQDESQPAPAPPQETEDYVPPLFAHLAT